MKVCSGRSGSVLACSVYSMWVCSHLPFITLTKHLATAPHRSMWDNENWDTKFISVPGSGTHCCFLVFFFINLEKGSSWHGFSCHTGTLPPNYRHPPPLWLWQPHPSDCPSLPVISLLPPYRHLKPAVVWWWTLPYSESPTDLGALESLLTKSSKATSKAERRFPDCASGSCSDSPGWRLFALRQGALSPSLATRAATLL